MRNCWLTLIGLLLLSPTLMAAKLEYRLSPVKIADNTWLLEGKREGFTRMNGGNIVNIVFIVTQGGVVVFDSGPSKRYGEALKAEIKKITDKPVTDLFNSHHHPDHFLGNQVFPEATIWALEKTGQQIKQHGDGLAENMYRLVGDWMRGTEVTAPRKVLKPGVLVRGKHRLRLMALQGHSGSDLALYDETTGVLLASDLVFYDRTATTPHTPGLTLWIKDLEKLKALDYALIVPGHGPTDTSKRAIQQTIDYLQWMDDTMHTSAAQGLSMMEVMALPIDRRFQSIALHRNEFNRSVFHLYPRYEDAAF